MLVLTSQSDIFADNVVRPAYYDTSVAMASCPFGRNGLDSHSPIPPTALLVHGSGLLCGHEWRELPSDVSAKMLVVKEGFRTVLYVVVCFVSRFLYQS